MGNHDIEQQVLAWIAAQGDACKWLLMRDHNATPSQNPFCDVLKPRGDGLVAVTDEQGALLPTRFAGNRCIDYGVANAVRLEGQCQIALSVISDHKVLQLNVRLPEGSQSGQVHA